MSRYLILIILVVLVVGLGVGFYLHVRNGGNLASLGIGKSQGSSNDDGSVQVVDPSTVQISEVHYKDGSFTPKNIILKRKSPGDPGCLITVANDSKDLLSVRVGPFESGKPAKGFPYPSVAPGRSGMIDPRYGSIVDISFYSVEKPDAIFSAHLEPTCVQ